MRRSPSSCAIPTNVLEIDFVTEKTFWVVSGSVPLEVPLAGDLGVAHDDEAPRLPRFGAPGDLVELRGVEVDRSPGQRSPIQHPGPTSVWTCAGGAGARSLLPSVVAPGACRGEEKRERPGAVRSGPVATGSAASPRSLRRVGEVHLRVEEVPGLVEDLGPVRRVGNVSASLEGSQDRGRIRPWSRRSRWLGRARRERARRRSRGTGAPARLPSRSRRC